MQVHVTTGKSLEFDPYNWLSKDKRSVHLNNSRANFAWGAGQRRCVGQYLAFTELVTEVVALAREVAAVRVDPEIAAQEFTPFTYPSALPLVLVPRRQTAQEAAAALSADSTPAAPAAAAEQGAAASA
jgi:cytochrome P450